MKTEWDEKEAILKVTWFWKIVKKRNVTEDSYMVKGLLQGASRKKEDRIKKSQPWGIITKEKVFLKE